MSFPGTKGVAAKKMLLAILFVNDLLFRREETRNHLAKRKSWDFPQDAKVVFAFGGSQRGENN